MKRNSKNNRLIIVLVAFLLLTACTNGSDHADHKDSYTCPMHPAVISDKPGICPICGMDLVKTSHTGEGVEITEDLAKLTQSPNEKVVSTIKTIKAEYKSIPISIKVSGIVTYDTKNIYTIPARVSGRLEKVYLRSEFQQVIKGQKIAEIYSPELIAAQKELVFLIEHDSENKLLINAAKHKLELMGLSAFQINELVTKKTSPGTITIFSPHSGYLITTLNTTVVPAYTQPSASDKISEGMSDGMATSTSGVTSSTTNTDRNAIVREGNYVNAGQTLFSIIDARNLRIELNLPSAQANIVKKGDKVRLDFDGGVIEDTSIEFIHPFVEGQNFVKLRVFTSDLKNLHVGHLVKAKMILPSNESFWVPRLAVVDLGTSKVVFVKARGLFEPKKVNTGISSGEILEITSGLASADEIAANAQYLVDSESFIKINQ